MNALRLEESSADLLLGTTRNVDYDLVINRFEHVAQSRQDAIALSYVADGDQHTSCDISYGRLNDMANSIARCLDSRGIGEEDVVGIMVNHDPFIIAAILAVLKIGGCFLPLDSGAPADRAKRIAQDSGLTAILTATSQPGYSLYNVDVIPMDRHYAGPFKNYGSTKLSSANAVYVIYTSGSTGEPKGVVVTHGGLANHCNGFSDRISLSADDVVLQFANLAFDAAYEEIFPCLCAGARLVLKNSMMENDVLALMGTCNEWQTTILDLPTAFWRMLTGAVRDGAVIVPSSVRWIVIGGEEAPSEEIEYWAKHYREQLQLLNTYGPTEATIIATSVELLENAPYGEGEVPLGDCLPGLNLTLRQAGATCKQGQDGEIYLSGAGLARGYLNDPQLTAARFVPDASSHDGGRTYRTGDVASFSSSGDLLFKGRVDNQIKLNGYRIQLEEVERALLCHPEIATCAVMLQDDRVGGMHLVAYCVLKEKDASLPFEGRPLNVLTLREFLSGLLPEYMLPGQFSFLEKFILNSSGKIDRAKLPQIGYFDRRHRRLPDYQKPTPGTEMALARIWCTVLDLDPAELSAEDPFEYLGGNSLYSIQVTYKARQAGLSFKPSDMHLRQTIRGLAACCRTSKGLLGRAIDGLADGQRYLMNVGSVMLNDLKRPLALRRRPREAYYRQIVNDFYVQLENQQDILYVFFTTHLLHWLSATLSFVPAHVNIVLIGSGLTTEELRWVQDRIDRPFLHLEEEVDLDLIWDILFTINTKNFGWLDPDCFVMNPALFREMREFGPDDAINCMWTHAACGPTKRPFHVIESYFLFFNISVIHHLKSAGILPRPSDQVASLRQVRLLRKLIPADDLKANPYTSVSGTTLSHRLFKFEFDRLILFQLMANASGFKLNRVRFFTEIDTFNPYNYYSDEAIHVFPTIRQYDQTPWSGVDQKRRLSSDYLLMRSMIDSLPPLYEHRLRFLEAKFAEMDICLGDLEKIKATVRKYLLDRGVSPRTLERSELSWLAAETALSVPAR